MQEDGRVDALVVWFDVGFDKGLDTKISFSTGPFTHPTHWKQTMLMIDGEFNLVAGDVISGTIACKRNLNHHRELDIKVSFNSFDKEGNKIGPNFI